MATSTHSFVRIFAFLGNSMISNIPERHIHKSSSASVISIWMRAINKLLLREWYKFTIFIEFNSF
jgi:5'-3' exonuclease